MTSTIQKSIIFILLSFFAAVQLGAQDNWKPVMEKDDITVYTRPAEGCPLDEFKGVTIIKAKLETCVAVLRDVPEQPNWMGDCLGARLLKTFDRNHIVAYNILNAPWPLSNRDLQIDTRFEEDYRNGKVIVSMTVYEEELVPVSKYVRIKDFRAQCILEKIDATTTKATYINRVNPMAPVPGAIANMFVKNNPYMTLKGFKKMVKLKKYQQ